jgi:hypothetical protein
MANTRSKLHRATARADERADDAIASVRRGKNHLRDEADDAIDTGGQYLEDIANQTGRALHRAYAETNEKLTDTAESARDMVHANPLLALGGAFVAGLFASALLRR